MIDLSNSDFTAFANGAANAAKNMNNNSGVNIGPGSTGSGSSNNAGPSIPVQPALKQIQKDPALDRLINYNQKAANGDFKPALFRDQEIKEVLAILSMHDHPNALLTGPAGVGKTAIAQELARRIVNNDPVVTNTLGKDTVIYELPISSLVAGNGVVGQLEETVQHIIDFASDPKNHVLLYIDEIHQLFTSSSSSYDTIAQILKPALARGDLHVLASTTTEEARFLKEDAAFSRRFTEVVLPEFTKDQMAEILIKLKPIYEKFHHMTFDDKLALPIVKLAHQYGVNRHDPDLTISLVDRTLSNYRIQLLSLNLQANNVSVPLSVFKHNAKLILAKGFSSQAAQTLTKLLAKHFVGQDKAQKQLLDVLKFKSLDLLEPERPTSLLFAGPTGVGKTELAKLVAQALYGSKKNLIYLNMTEYSDPMSLSKLIGSSAGYVGSDSARPLPLDTLASNPYQVVLLDEFEKAAANVKQVFMQALDEGTIETNHGEKINFKHALVIATTNAGTHNAPSVGFNKQDNDEIDDLKNDLPIELLNRFEHVIEFDALSVDDYKQILKIKYNELSQAIFEHSGIKLTPETLDLTKDYDFINSLASDTYNPNLNGRPAKRSVLNYIENQIANTTNKPHA